MSILSWATILGKARHNVASSKQLPHLIKDLKGQKAVCSNPLPWLEQEALRLESGQTLLATTASIAPFVGLLGTVWGIYHALIRIGETGSASLDKVAGPVGEALVMTALGLAVAIPAALAYNVFQRQARLRLMQIEQALRSETQATL